MTALLGYVIARASQSRGGVSSSVSQRGMVITGAPTPTRPRRKALFGYVIAYLLPGMLALWAVDVQLPGGIMSAPLAALGFGLLLKYAMPSARSRRRRCASDDRPVDGKSASVSVRAQ